MKIHIEPENEKDKEQLEYIHNQIHNLCMEIDKEKKIGFYICRR